MSTHSSILAWRILWTEEPGGLLSIGWIRLKQFSSSSRKDLISRMAQKGKEWEEIICPEISR